MISKSFRKAALRRLGCQLDVLWAIAVSSFGDDRLPPEASAGKVETVFQKHHASQAI